MTIFEPINYSPFNDMEYKDLIAARHSVRKFTDQKVERKLIDEIIAEALTAPSSRNCKSSEFLVVEDKAKLEAMAAMRESGSGLIAGAAAAIVVMGDASKTDLWVDNAAISTTFIQLSAVDKGLGSCWVHVNGRMRSKTDASLGYAEDYLRTIVDIPEGRKVLCVVALGYEAL